MELLVRHLIHDILIKKTVDKVLKLLRKLHWKDPVVRSFLPSPSPFFLNPTSHADVPFSYGLPSVFEGLQTPAQDVHESLGTEVLQHRRACNLGV
jgi:hypothetical protein